MLKIALETQICESARRVSLVEVSSETYYGEGYQDIQTRVPRIDNTCNDLHWRPKTDMLTALQSIFDAYAQDLQRARELSPSEPFPVLGEHAAA